MSVLLILCAGLGACARAESWQTWLAKADSLWLATEYDSALESAKQALEIAEKERGAQDTSVATILQRIGVIYDDEGVATEAAVALNRSLSIRERLLGPDHPDVAAALNNLGILYYGQARYAEAEKAHQRALAIRKRCFGGEDAAVAGSLTNLANVYWIQNRYAEVEPLYLEALGIRERLSGADHPDVALVLNNLGCLYEAEGRYADAVSAYNRALEIRQAAFGYQNLQVAITLYNLGHLFSEQGRYPEAESCLKSALSIRETILGPDHPEVATTLNNLAVVYGRENRKSDAESLYRRTLDIWERARGLDHPDVALAANNLANLLESLGRYGEAEALYSRALRIQEAAVGRDNRDVADVLNNLAILYEDQQRFAEAETHYRRAMAIRESALGEQHPDFAESLDNLAGLYTKMGRDSEAERLHTRALTLWRGTLGPEHPNVATSLNGLANAFFAQGRLTEAVADERQAYLIRRDNFNDGSAGMCERSTLQFSRLLKQEAANYLSLLLEAADNDTDHSREIADIVFSTKSLVTDGLLTRGRAIVAESDSTTLRMANALQQSRFILSRLYLGGMRDADVESYRERLRMAVEDKERREEELAQRSVSFSTTSQRDDIEADAVIHVLPPGTALVEYVKYAHRLNGSDAEDHYLAVTVTQGGTIRATPLGNAPAIDSKVSDWRELACRPMRANDASLDSVSAQLYRQLWRPLADEVTGASTVFVVPDGDLNLLAFAALKDEAGRYVIEAYPVHYLSSVWDLLQTQEIPASGHGLLCIGDPDFGTAGSHGEIDLSESDCGDLSRRAWYPLPGTRHEVESVLASWRQVSSETATGVLGADATEKNFKCQSPGKRVIHVATHGYYIPDKCETGKLRSHGASQGEAEIGFSALLRSGFVLAGANRRSEGASVLGEEDGIVTAEDIAGLNLQGTELVVLSACESGLGTVESGEGVFGLRRAFQLAGARTVVSSLWPVDDATTSDFVKLLFSPSQEALPQIMQQAALTRISWSREHGRPDDPYYWAAFIATGDWQVGQ